MTRPFDDCTLPENLKLEQRDKESASDVQVKLGGEPLQNGLAQLALTLIKLLHELMEQQAIRRMDSGSLTEEEVERLGMTLMQQQEEIDRLKRVFHLNDEDLNLDLGPLGKLF
ncbi:gas vesicle protein K [Zooshikella marina]|uniref:gas vesicle protein K n=1 Tax=Zooshikella ganghwensis TaxID=202772 RepID=UPI001BAF3634|nr:gas vesicle protein K [Zooshikella ganghwensis]MBU2704748.1 gas vesicle protein K [Zooshikella ganghwensis]